MTDRTNHYTTAQACLRDAQHFAAEAGERTPWEEEHSYVQWAQAHALLAIADALAANPCDCVHNDAHAANEVRQEREFLQYRLSLKDTLMQMRDDMGLTSDDVPDLPQDPPLSQVQETSRAMGLRLYWSLMFEEDAS